MMGLGMVGVSFVDSEGVSVGWFGEAANSCASLKEGEELLLASSVERKRMVEMCYFLMRHNRDTLQ